MTDTDTLIARLSGEADTPVKLLAPGQWVVRLISVLVIYALGAQLYLGLRPDLATQISSFPLFTLEIGLLVVLVLASAVASVIAMYPDACQKPKLLLLPYAIFTSIVGLVAFQIIFPPDVPVMQKPGMGGMSCALCIASVALLPSALIFALLRMGASVHPFQAGCLAVLSASAIGCLTLRLSEINDSMIHLVSWHYAPTLLFAMLGAIIGKFLLKW